MNVYVQTKVFIRLRGTMNLLVLNNLLFHTLSPGADPGFQVRGGGAHLKKLRRAEGGAIFFLVFRVKNHDFTPKNHIIFNCRGRRENFGVFRVKNHDFTPKNNKKFQSAPVVSPGCL